MRADMKRQSIGFTQLEIYQAIIKNRRVIILQTATTVGVQDNADLMLGIIQHSKTMPRHYGRL